MRTKRYFRYLTIFSICVCFSLKTISAQIVNVGSGSYTTALPSGRKGPTDSNGNPLNPAVTSNVSGAIPTNDWCSSLVFKRDPATNHSHTMFPHPLGVQCKADGLGLGYPNEVSVSGNSYSYGLPVDLTIGFSGLSSADTKLHDYSDWTQTASWDNGALKITCGHGLPFIYAEVEQANALITCAGTPNVWFNDNGVLGITVGTRHYGIFAPSGSQWIINGASLSSTLNSKKYFSAAVLPDTIEATITFYKQYAYAFITDTRASWEYDIGTSKVITTYTVETEIKEGTEGKTLLALYLHQWKNSSASFTDYEYVSVRGPMKVLAGNQFTTEIPYTGVLPSQPYAAELSSGFSAQTLEGYIDTMESQSADQLIRVDGDTYWTGKDFGRVAMLVRIAHQIGDFQARDYFLSTLKTKLEGWLTAEAGETAELFYHDSNWGVLIGYNGSFGSDVELNDHHFHYGYFIMAAATVAQFDRAWAEASAWGGMVETIIRDVANTKRGDTFSPFLRCFDPYAGHGWAAGHANFGDGNNQESTSESTNFSTSLILWGMVTENDTLRDLGVYLYSTEVEALLHYWMDVHNDVFPANFTPCALGMVWGGKSDHATWFSAEPEMIHGINMLPITGGSLYLGLYPNYVEENYNEIVQENGGPVNEWKDVMWEFLAFTDPGQAIQNFNSDPNYSPEDGETKAHTYHHLHNMNVLGHVDRTVTADIPTFAVFDKEGIKTYVIYNHRDESVNVTFSNNKAFTVPADTLIYLGDSSVGIIDNKYEKAVLADNISFMQNGGRITVNYAIKQQSPVLLELYNTKGNLIKTYINTTRSQGSYTTIINLQKRMLPNGIYFLHFKAGNFSKSKKIEHIK